jgi:hypothetical protein
VIGMGVGIRPDWADIACQAMHSDNYSA